MKRNLLALVFAISLIALIYLAFRTQPAQAQKSSVSNEVAQQKLEYCAITGIGTMNEGGNAVGISTIVYFDTAEYREETVKIQGEKVGVPIRNEYEKARQRAFSAAFAQLGNQGWEMIGQHAFPFSHYFSTESQGQTALYFKRIKR